MLGLFTSKAYMEPADAVPIARRKLQQVLAAEDLVPGSHDYKVAVALIENFPLDELLVGDDRGAARRRSSSCSSCRSSASVRLFAHRDIYGRSVSLLVALPRDRFNAELRQHLQDLFMERFHGASVDYHLALGETDPAQIHFRIHVAEGADPRRVPSPSSSRRSSRSRAPGTTGCSSDSSPSTAKREGGLWSRWEGRLPEYYKSSTDIMRAVLDIEQLEQLGADDGPRRRAPERARSGRAAHARRALQDRRARGPLGADADARGARARRSSRRYRSALRAARDDGDIFLHDFGVLGADGTPLDVERGRRPRCRGDRGRLARRAPSPTASTASSCSPA